MKYELLQALLPYLENYEKNNPKSVNPQHFAAWLVTQTTEAPNYEYQEEYAGDSPELSISRLVVFMNRYARMYGRKALEGSPLGSTDEFVYLVSLYYAGPMSKTDIIQRNRHEKPTGMDIIKRLLALDLIEQKEDPADRRSKLLGVTPAGQEVIKQLYGRMTLVSHLVVGNLNATERLQLWQLLEKLERFHQVLLAKSKNDSFDGVIRKFKST